MFNFKKFLTALLLIISVLTISACTRSRNFRNQPTQQATQVIMLATATIVEPTSTIQPTTEINTAVPVSMEPSPTIVVVASPNPEIQGDLAELDNLLNELDNLFRDTNTNIEVP